MAICMHSVSSSSHQTLSSKGFLSIYILVHMELNHTFYWNFLASVLATTKLWHWSHAVYCSTVTSLIPCSVLLNYDVTDPMQSKLPNCDIADSMQCQLQQCSQVSIHSVAGNKYRTSVKERTCIYLVKSVLQRSVVNTTECPQLHLSIQDTQIKH